jgi:hypothetical protein
MKVPTNLLGKLRQRRKLGKPQLPGLKKEFPNITLWPMIPKLKGKKTRYPPQPLRSRFQMVSRIDFLAQLLRSELAIGYMHPT